MAVLMDYERRSDYGTAGRRKKPHTGVMDLVTRGEVLMAFRTPMREAGIPVEYWDREDMILQKALAKPLRDLCHTNWMVMPAITGGDTLGEAVDKTVKAIRREPMAVARERGSRYG